MATAGVVKGCTTHDVTASCTQKHSYLRAAKASDNGVLIVQEYLQFIDMVGLHYRSDPRRNTTRGEEQQKQEMEREPEQDQQPQPQQQQRHGADAQGAADNHITVEPTTSPSASTNTSGIEDLQMKNEELMNHVKQLEDYDAEITKNNAKLAQEKAAAVKEKANLHARFTMLIRTNDNLNTSHAKRVQEKDAVVQENVELCEANADLRVENADLVADKNIKDRKIEKLEKENEALLVSKKSDHEEIARITAERDHIQRRLNAVIRDMERDDQQRKRAQSQTRGKRSPDRDGRGHKRNWDQASGFDTKAHEEEDRGRRKNAGWPRKELGRYERREHDSYYREPRERGERDQHRPVPPNQSDRESNVSGSDVQYSPLQGGLGKESWKPYQPPLRGKPPPPTGPKADRKPST
ncbi:hypothetical protein CC80DRAFT_532996 [Byssothecium circinans]|uniref:Uncharacterized protein n=1 Tax=Byssothecium circinans TaxID=147558 RepID=A0A6A5U9R6_9PLEO|nr:hypothetical protein CC80DRAFT_532996 [Byssothecium circinans]